MLIRGYDGINTFRDFLCGDYKEKFLYSVIFHWQL